MQKKISGKVKFGAEVQSKENAKDLTREEVEMIEN